MVNRFYLPDTPVAALGRALHFIALAGLAEAATGRRRRELIERAKRAHPREYQSIARQYSMLMEEFNRRTAPWWRIAELWPYGFTVTTETT